MTNTKTNPFILNYGYEENHDMALSGYGLTFESIQHWLFEQNLPTNPIGYLNAVSANSTEYNDITEIDAFAMTGWFDHQIPTDLEVVETANVESGPLLMVCDFGPGKTQQVVKSIFDTDADLVKVIRLIFNVAEKYQMALAEFVAQYADNINICDFS